MPKKNTRRDPKVYVKKHPAIIINSTPTTGYCLLKRLLTTRLPHFSRSLRFGSWNRADSSRKSLRLRSGGSSRSLLNSFVLSMAAQKWYYSVEIS
ncbi:hypothetical protein PUN28_012594 [Cardiocondyla obscurior]|uniref:Uncharacterized protein n=1 Tax=Cardiocondyla obscurior TaxID=286306 RepID=A0AAW2FHJ9_9HYME